MIKRYYITHSLQRFVAPAAYSFNNHVKMTPNHVKILNNVKMIKLQEQQNIVTKEFGNHKVLSLYFHLL